MTTLRLDLLDRIQYHIEMHQNDLEDLMQVKAEDNDEDFERVSYTMKRIRNLKQLFNILNEGKMPAHGSPLGYCLRDVMEEMMDIDTSF